MTAEIDEDRVRERLARERERVEASLAELRRNLQGERAEIQTATDPADDAELIEEEQVDDALAEQLSRSWKRSSRSPPARGYLRALGRERRADSGRAPRGDPLGRADRGGGAPAVGGLPGFRVSAAIASTRSVSPPDARGRGATALRRPGGRRWPS